MSRIRAFIDLGTNTFHLLIASFENGNANILFKTKEIVGLGAGGINDRIIRPDAQERGLACLLGFAQKCNELKVDQVNAFGTSALRHSRNSDEFLKKVKLSTGFKIEIIDGEREAELIQLGISSSITHIEEPYLIMDIGGGSTEFILVKNDEIQWKRSFEVGVQRLLSTYFKDDPLPKEEHIALRDYLDNLLSELEGLRSLGPINLVGASGTFTTLSRIYAAESDIALSPTLKVPATYFTGLFEKLIKLPRSERLELPGMSAPRVDLIVVGSCLVNYVMESFEFDGFYISGNGLKEGAMLLASKGKL